MNHIITYRRVAFRDQATQVALDIRNEIERDCLSRLLIVRGITEDRTPWHGNPLQAVEMRFTVTVEPIPPDQESLLHLAWEEGFKAGIAAHISDAKNPYARGPA